VGESDRDIPVPTARNVHLTEVIAAPAEHLAVEPAHTVVIAADVDAVEESLRTLCLEVSVVTEANNSVFIPAAIG
jgi:hypothetical protein